MQALFPMNLNNWYGLPAQGVAVDDFADDNFDHSALDFIGGGNMYVYSDRRPIGAASMNTFGKVPQWGSAWKAFVKKNADRWHGAYIQKTTLPYEDNYLDLDPTVKDPLGLPGVPDHRRVQRQRTPRGCVCGRQDGEWYKAAGATDVVRLPIGDDGAVHARLRRYAHGEQPGHECREPVGLRPRGAEPGSAWRVGDGHERFSQPHSDRTGTRVAHSGAPGQELENYRVASVLQLSVLVHLRFGP